MSCENGLKIFQQFGLRSACSFTVNSGILREFYFLLKTLSKRHICHIKNSRLGHDLPTSVNDRDFALSQGC